MAEESRAGPEGSPTGDGGADERVSILERRLQDAEAATAAVVGRYREARLAAAPDIPAELVTGATVDEVDAAIERAQRIVDAIRERLATGARVPAPAGTNPAIGAAPSVPAGPVARSAPASGWGGMTPAQRIRNALNERS